eukprot:4024531-Amphidinium_carterae.1
MDMLSLTQQVQQKFFEPISCILARNFAAAVAASMGDSKLQESAVKQVRARYQANAQPLALCVAATAATPGASLLAAPQCLLRLSDLREP